MHSQIRVAFQAECPHSTLTKQPMSSRKAVRARSVRHSLSFLSLTADPLQPSEVDYTDCKDGTPITTFCFSVKRHPDACIHGHTVIANVSGLVSVRSCLSPQTPSNLSDPHSPASYSQRSDSAESKARRRREMPGRIRRARQQDIDSEVADVTSPGSFLRQMRGNGAHIRPNDKGQANGAKRGVCKKKRGEMNERRSARVSLDVTSPSSFLRMMGMRQGRQIETQGRGGSKSDGNGRGFSTSPVSLAKTSLDRNERTRVQRAKGGKHGGKVVQRPDIWVAHELLDGDIDSSQAPAAVVLSDRMKQRGQSRQLEGEVGASADDLQSEAGSQVKWVANETGALTESFATESVRVSDVTSVQEIEDGKGEGNCKHEGDKMNQIANREEVEASGAMFIPDGHSHNDDEDDYDGRHSESPYSKRRSKTRAAEFQKLLDGLEIKLQSVFDSFKTQSGSILLVCAIQNKSILLEPRGTAQNDYHSM